MDAKAINKWRQEHKRLFYQFPSEWVAFSPEKGILGHNSSRKIVGETLLAAGYSRLDFIMEYIHPYEVVRPKRLRAILNTKGTGYYFQHEFHKLHKINSSNS